jgi:signal transduction histidine kinase/CheY-like chemotaxis protein
MSKKLRDLARPFAPVSPGDSGAEVYARFQEDPDSLALAVLDEEGRPVGIVERNAFFLHMAGEYGRALYARRPIEILMQKDPATAEGAVLVADFCRSQLAERPSELMHGFVVTEAGRYAGVGTALDLLKASSDAAAAHAEDMVLTVQALEQARAEAQAALEARSRFLAVMNHEIRTPLNGVLAIAELVSRRLEQAELKPYVATILSSGETLLRLLTDALDLSRAGAGALQLVEAPFAPSSLLAEVSALWGPRAAERGISLTFGSRAAADLQLVGDRVRLEQVLNNLIGNAIKFTDEGGVEVALVTAPTSGGVRLRIEVSDTGVGVPEAQSGGLFSPFGQTSEGLVRGGAGLGLSVCRELAGLMGGAVGVRPNAPRGSVFWFEAQLRVAEAATPAAPAPAAPAEDVALPALRVLIADDNPTNRLVAATLCEQLGCTSEAVANGALAVEALQCGRFDLVLMDIRMPVLDGVAAARAIRALPGPAARTPILALTANADPAETERYLREGLDGVVQKPIKVAALAEAMAAVLESSPGPQRGERAVG